MKVIYLTDDRSTYVGGYYYNDWFDVFDKNTQLIGWGPSFPLPSRQAFNTADLVVIGHGGHDLLMQAITPVFHRKIARWFGFYMDDWERRLKKLGQPKVLLSKNDYKNIDKKAKVVEEYGIDLVITHTKRAVSEFNKFNVFPGWIPFGVNRGLFRPSEQKNIDIGFIGNLQDQWNGGMRRKLVEATNRMCSDYILDIQTNNNCEGFLFGAEYAAWTARCHLALNTVSAWGTVGPKWWEQMACKTVPVAPVDDYEGLLSPDKHYVAVKSDMSDLRSKVDLFFTDADYRGTIFTEMKNMEDYTDMKNVYKILMTIISEHGLLS